MKTSSKLKRKVRKILKTTKMVFKEVSYPNGAILASTTRDISYPKDVKSYDFVWPRDASFVCVASDLLGIHKIPKKFFEWCWEYAEGFRENGIFLYHKYFPNARAAGDWDKDLSISYLTSKKLIEFAKQQLRIRIYYSHFQPDHTGSVLWAIYEHSKIKRTSNFEELIKKAANGICNYWKKDHFKIPSIDLWEERPALPKFSQAHPYTVAISKRGLECACKLLGENEKWKKCIREMEKVLEKSFVAKVGYFVKTIGRKIDKTIDSSSLGLVWPSQCFPPDDPRIIATVREIEAKCVKSYGVYRYPNDLYDGRIVEHQIVLGGAGAWPILNFWMSIYQVLVGNREKALKYFKWVLERVRDKIPEQIKNDKPISVLPLAWGHAMFVISGAFLGVIKTKYLNLLYEDYLL
ncbi:MAG TPA: glycoside hydrolase family 15 protein [Candidatus Aenigmarchaeota archaeon]|nr:glycoside hydrolase family 15 protein [Candidatus Aenigmarchaeota archaeon]